MVLNQFAEGYTYRSNFSLFFENATISKGMQGIPTLEQSQVVLDCRNGVASIGNKTRHKDGREKKLLTKSILFLHSVTL